MRDRVKSVQCIRCDGFHGPVCGGATTDAGIERIISALRDGPCECACDGCLSDDHCDRASCAQPA